VILGSGTFAGEEMPKCPKIVGLLMLGTALSSGTMPVGTPAAASTGGAAVTGLGSAHRAARGRARRPT